MLLESCSLDEAMQTAEVLRTAIGEFKFMWEERSFRLGVSIGVVPITADNEDVAGMLSAADSACAAAKEAGRNRLGLFVKCVTRSGEKRIERYDGRKHARQQSADNKRHDPARSPGR